MWGVGSADIGLSPAGVASRMDVDDVALVVSEVYRTFFSRLYNHFWRVSSSSSCTNCVRTLQQCNFGLFGEEVATSSLQDLRAQHCSRRNFSIATTAEVKWLGARAVVRWRMTCCWLNIEYININPRTHTHTHPAGSPDLDIYSASKFKEATLSRTRCCSRRYRFYD